MREKNRKSGKIPSLLFIEDFRQKCDPSSKCDVKHVIILKSTKNTSKCMEKDASIQKFQWTNSCIEKVPG